MNNPTLEIVHGQVFTTSLDIGRCFEKAHRVVIRAIENILPNLSESFLQLNFEKIIGGEPVRKLTGDPAKIGGVTCSKLSSQIPYIYRLTKNGFAMIALGFTGEKAIQFREAYITRFDEMETRLKEMESAQTRRHIKEQSVQLLLPNLKEVFLNDRPSISVSSAYDLMIIRGLYIPPISKNQIIGLIKKGALEGYKNNHKWHIYQDSFAEWLKIRKLSA